MTYISSGQLRADLEQLMGVALVREPDADEEDEYESSEDDEAEEDDDAFTLDGFTPELRAELEALIDLAENWSPPQLCVLKWGDFCPSPWQNGADRDEVLEEWFDGDEAATDFVMRAVSVVHGGGGFYVLVNEDGRMGILCEDPHSFDRLDCTLPQFLKTLVSAHHMVSTRGLEAAEAELIKVVGTHAALLLTFAGRLAPKG
ncbi:hypothetical protein [Myxococcus xanthus]|uniref:Uncharacterized protein n=1 Tax=Myxococcus xanthus TaxID=34 RepID=A0A7Y4IJN5_MYXXA|nr:hypothetical protein [Myxococcus xanthus]NOJ80394.1 hypothetical protein [Myxococcus xanthus]NOJ84927.1 hypothetical protein [Myxococcus xanthus]